MLSIHKPVSCLATFALALVFVLATAFFALPHQAVAASSPTITVTRASTGKLTVKVGTSYKLASKTTAGKLTYKSSKMKVVTVSKKGVLKAKKAGKSTITVTAKSGSKKSTKKIKVTVVKKSKYKKVTGLTAKAGSASLAVGKTTTVKTAFKPAKASNKNVTYKSSNSSVLSIDAYGKATANNPGSATVTVTSCDNSKAKARVAFTVTAASGGGTSGKPASGGGATPTPAKPKLANLQASPQNFVEGSEDAESLFTVEASGVRSVDLKAGSRNIAMNDSGYNGDKKDGDGIWSATVDFTDLSAGQSVDCTATAAGLTAGPLTVTAFPEWSEELETQARSQTQTANDAVAEAIEPYVDDNTSYIESTENLAAARIDMEQALQKLVEDGIAVSYSMSSTGGSIKLSTGPRCQYTLPIEGIQADVQDVRIEFWSPDQVGCNPTDGVSVHKRLENEEVTCQAIIDDMPQNSVIWWFGHGSFDTNTGSYLILTQKFSEAAASMGWGDLTADRVSMIFSEDGITDTGGPWESACAAVGVQFFRQYKPDMSGDIFIASVCCGAENGWLARAMQDCGCKGFFGFTDVVTTQYDEPLAKTLMNELVMGSTLGEAFSYATGMWGDTQYHFFQKHAPLNILCTNDCSPTVVYGDDCAMNGGTCGTCKWHVNAYGQLTVGAGTLPSNDHGDRFFWPWSECADQIRSVEFSSDTKLSGSAAYMFEGCENLTSVIGLSNWDVSKVDDMEGMFSFCTSLSNPSGLSSWDVSKVDNMEKMFEYCASLESVSTLSTWDVSGVTWMSNMFNECRSLADLSPLANWNMSAVKYMSGMFNGCQSLADLSPLANWNVSGARTMDDMFAYCSSISNLSSLSKWKMSNVVATDYMFDGLDTLTDLTPLSSWDMSSVTSLDGMFCGCTSLETASGLSSWNVSSVTSLNGMFYGCSSLTNLSDLSSWKNKMPGLKDTSYMFTDCTSLTDLSFLSGWNVSGVTSMVEMFGGCTSLTNLSPLSSWNVSNVTTMELLFAGCTSLRDASPLNSWTVNGELNTDWMFSGCDNLTTYPSWYTA